MSFQTIGIGEIVWDVFPEYKRLGGAPYNYAFHCGQLGARAGFVSGIGRDESGCEIKNAAVNAGIDISLLQEIAEFPTGTVQVVLNQGKPVYEIRSDVAWDYIKMTPDLFRTASATDAVCFGTLAQRNEASRRTIRMFVDACPHSALKIYDINLRQSFFSKALIARSLALANVLKLSDEELPVLAELFNLSGDVETQLHGLLQGFSLELVAYTRGPEGSILHSVEETSVHAGCDGLAVDSVGAGDSFTAALTIGLLQGWSLEETNDFANRVATFVCSQKGATPILPDKVKRREKWDKTTASCFSGH